MSSIKGTGSTACRQALEEDIWREVGEERLSGHVEGGDGIRGEKWVRREELKDVMEFEFDKLRGSRADSLRPSSVEEALECNLPKC